MTITVFQMRHAFLISSGSAMAAVFLSFRRQRLPLTESICRLREEDILGCSLTL